VQWLYGDVGADDQEKEKKDEDEDVLDETQLGGDENSDGTVESGVTSGADPSDWDPIDIDAKP
jgi:hypothetical protein